MSVSRRSSSQRLSRSSCAHQYIRCESERGLVTSSCVKSVPSYAQPTFSSQHGSAKLKAEKRHSSLKAGASRPSSMSTLKVKLSHDTKAPPETPSKPVLQKKPSFVQLFHGTTDDRIKDTGAEILTDSPSTLNRTPNYRAPSLIHKVHDFVPKSAEDASFYSVIGETEALIKNFLDSAGVEGLAVPDPSALKQKVSERGSASTEEWDDLVNRYSVVIFKLQEKILSDQKLIENVLELNNYVSRKCKSYQTNLDTARSEINYLRNQLRMFGIVPEKLKLPTESDDRTRLDNVFRVLSGASEKMTSSEPESALLSQFTDETGGYRLSQTPDIMDSSENASEVFNFDGVSIGASSVERYVDQGRSCNSGAPGNIYDEVFQSTANGTSGSSYKMISHDIVKVQIL